MRENIARGVRGIARNEERLKQYVIAENYQGDCDETCDSRDLGRGAL